MKVPRGWTRQQWIQYQIDKVRKDREAREREIQAQEDKQREAAKSAQNNQLVQAGATLGGKYLYDKGLSGVLKDLGGASDTIKNFFGGAGGASEAGNVVSQAGSAESLAGLATPVEGMNASFGGNAMVPPTGGLENTGFLSNQFSGFGANLGTALGLAGALYGGYNLVDGIDSKAGRKAGAMSGATMGAGIGTMIAPGLGTALGAVIGAGLGALGGNLRSGKSKEQQLRDDQRKEFLHSMGREKQAGDFTVGLADGSKYDFGLDGGAKYKGVQGNTLNPYDLDLQNPLAGEASKYSGIIGGLGGIYDSQLQSQLARGLLQGAQGADGVKANARAILAQQGVQNADQAIAKLKQLYPGAPMTQTIAAVNELYAGNPAPYQPPQQPQPQQPQAKTALGGAFGAPGSMPQEGQYSSQNPQVDPNRWEQGPPPGKPVAQPPTENPVPPRPVSAQTSFMFQKDPNWEALPEWQKRRLREQYGLSGGTGLGGVL